MTLKNSYSNYFKNTFKRKSWVIALSSLIFFLVLTLPSLMIMGKNVGESANVNRVIENLTLLLDYRGISVKVAFVVLAIIAGISAFSYLHNKAKVDFYHSFSIPRKTIFRCNFTTSITTVLIGYFINFFLTIILILSLGYGEAINTVEILTALAENILYYISTFSIVALCTILCGNTVITLILTSVAFFGQGALILLITGLKHFLYRTYFYDSNEIIKFVIKLSPATQFFNSNLEKNPTGRLLMFFIYVVVTAIIITISLLCFIKRKSEHSGIAIAFDKLKLPLKIYCCIIFALGFGIFFRLIVGRNLWIYFGIVLGILVAHALSEIAFDFSFNSILKNWKHGLIIIAVSCAVVLGMNFDITGYNTRTIEANNIKSFGVEFNSIRSYNNRESIKTCTINSPENIRIIDKLIKIGASVDEHALGEFTYFNVVVNKSSFGRFNRIYSIEMSEENINLINKIRYSEEYKKETSDIFLFDAPKSNTLKITSRLTDKSGNNIFLTDKETQNILNVIQEEYLNLTAKDGFNKPPVMLINIEQPKENNNYDYENWGYYNTTIPIYKSYSKTLGLLEEYKGIKIKQIDVNLIDKIVINNDELLRLENLKNKDKVINTNYIEDVTTFTNKADIEKLISNAIPNEFYYNIDRLSSNNYYTSIMIYFKEDYDPQYFMINGDDVYKLINN